MAKKIKVTDSGVVSEAQAGDRAERWAEHLALYETSNPVKFAQKKENGEFDTIPNTFK